jgi:glutathione S-transferase
MSKIRIFGSPQSRAFRALWAAKELGIDYELVTDYKTPDFAKVNPNAKIPALQDGDLTLFESMAINLYLAQKFGKGLWPASVADQGRTYQWSFWAMTEVEKPALTILMDTFGMKKDAEGAEAGKKALEKPFDILDQHLAGRDYVLGKDFTIVDINLASVIGWAKAGKVDLSRWPNLSAWLDRCQGRPAASAARKG